MARDTLSEYGPDSSQPQIPGISGGAPVAKPIPNYSPPVGPAGINDRDSPGLHGDNRGNCGTQK